MSMPNQKTGSFFARSLLLNDFFITGNSISLLLGLLSESSFPEKKGISVSNRGTGPFMMACLHSVW